MNVVQVGDEVTCSYPQCEGHTFVVSKVSESNNCYSKFLVVAHLKGSPDREIRGIVIDGIHYGIDMSYFKLIENDLRATQPASE
jgi:hypothetical protein